VWLAFGAIAIDRLNWTLVVYAVLSLTVVRMVPVALSLIGSGMDRDTVLFIGWFGPRGLASLVLALLALEAVGSAADDAVAVIAVTVVLSVLAVLPGQVAQACDRGLLSDRGVGPVMVVLVQPGRESLSTG
jgi:sodium/hydrogen antiporter